MGYRLRLGADHDGPRGLPERTVPQPEPPGDSAAGAAGMWWLWGLVELRLAQAEPDGAA